MDKYTYTLENLIEYAVGARLQFTEIFIWYIVKHISTQLISYHLNNRVYGALKPQNVLFYGGDVLLRMDKIDQPLRTRLKPTLVDRFYIPPEQVITTKYDIFPLGQILHSMIQGSPTIYSPTLFQLMKEMYDENYESRPSSQQILFVCNEAVSRERQHAMQRFEEEYGALYKTYAIEYESFLKRYRREALEIKQKKQQLTEMENAFFYCMGR